MPSFPTIPISTVAPFASTTRNPITPLVGKYAKCRGWSTSHSTVPV